MSYLSKAISEALVRSETSQADLARSSGIDEGKISRWINGQPTIKPRDLEKLVTAISENDVDRARIIVAHLKDQARGPGADLIEFAIHPRSKSDVPIHEAMTQYGKPLPPKLEWAFGIIRSRIDDPDVRDSVLSLANLLSKGDL